MMGLVLLPLACSTALLTSFHRFSGATTSTPRNPRHGAIETSRGPRTVYTIRGTDKAKLLGTCNDQGIHVTVQYAMRRHSNRRLAAGCLSTVDHEVAGIGRSLYSVVDSICTYVQSMQAEMFDVLSCGATMLLIVWMPR